MRDPRGPWDVPDEPDVAQPGLVAGFDTDGDGVADTTVVDDGFDLIVSTDLDGDGIVDQVLRIGADGAVHELEPVRADLPPDPPA